MKTFNEFMTEAKLSYDEFTGKGKDTWTITYTYGAGRGGSQTRTVGFTGIEPGTSRDEVIKKYKAKHKSHKVVDAVKRKD